MPLPIPVKATPVGPNTYHITQRQTQQTLHPRLGKTKVWGYDDGSTARSTRARRSRSGGTPTTVRYTNQLPRNTCCRSTLSIVPGGKASAGAPAHGFVSGANDGNPCATSFRASTRGADQTVHYPNKQPAATLWYHDHAIAITRLNVYAGLAGYYLIRDSKDTGREPNPIGIPGAPTRSRS